MRNDYFIIESLTSNDVNDGKILCDALKSTNCYNPHYQRVRTPKEFGDALIMFSKSNFRYLFISAHGDEENVDLIEGKYNAYDLKDLKIDLTKRRVFMSTCRGGSYLLAKYFIRKGVYSVIGSPDNLDQIIASCMWTTMAVVFERLNDNKIHFFELNKTIKQLVKIYQIRLAYYSFIRHKTDIKAYLYQQGTPRQRINYEIK